MKFAIICVLTACVSLMAACATSNPSGSAHPPGNDASAEQTPFCQRDFTDEAARRADVAQLQATGGLVRLLKRPQAAPPFKCAAYYLAHGLDVNAVSTQNDLTALHYAIKMNTPEMVQFVISQGADLHEKAGKHQLEPIAYAYYLAINHPQVNHNPVIIVINNALNRAD